MPLLRPSASDFTATVKAVAQYVAPGTVAAKPTKSGGGMILAPPSLGAVARTSQVGALISPRTSAVSINGLISAFVAASGFIDVWLNKAGLVSTLAGGASGRADATGTNAGFNLPFGVAVLPNGNVAVADFSNNLIRLVTPAGVVTTLAGGGSVGGTASGSANGTGTNATFSGPYSLAGLPNGNIVVADMSNNLVRLVTPAGVVTALAGGGTGTATDGVGTNATFDTPRGVAALPNGNIVVADTSNNRIRLVTPAGVVTTLAGGGTGTATNGVGTNATFNLPKGVAVLPNGNIVVSDNGNNLVRLVTPAGVVTTLAGGGSVGGTASGSDNGTGTNATFNRPDGVTVLPNGNIVVVDQYNQCIRLITMPGVVVTTLAGGNYGSTDGIGTNAQFRYPVGVAVLPNGNIVVADAQGYSIRLITPT